MDEKEITALFERHAKTRLTIIEDSKQERRQIKNSLRENKLCNILEHGDFGEAWQKLELASTNILIFTLSNKNGEKFLQKVIESTRFKKTPLIIFTSKIKETPKLYSSEGIITKWVEAPVNALKVEKAVLQVMEKGVMEKSLVGNDNIALEHYTSGMAAFEQGGFVKAKEAFRLALKSRPTFIEAYTKMTETLIALGEHATAKKVLGRAMTYSEDNYKGLMLNCQLAVEMEDKDKAIETWDYAASKRPGEIKFLIELGNLALSKGWPDEAIKYFEQAREIDPNLLHVYNRLGIAHSRAGRMDKAVEMYEKALAIDDNDAGVHFNIGMAHHRKDDDKTALKYFKDAARLDPDIQEASDWVEKLSS